MNNKKLALFLSAFLASTATIAQPIHFSNGDTLDVELIQQTETTVTFVHPFLGKQTIAKSSIINLQALDLVNLVNVPEGEEGVAVNAFNEAKKAVVPAKGVVDVAKQKVVIAQQNVKLATTDAEIEAAEHSLVIAEASFKLAEDKLVTAVESANTAEAYIKTARDVSLANVQVQAANDEMNVAMAKVELAQQDISVAKENVVIAEDTAEAVDIMSVDAKVEHAESLVDLAEDKLETAEDSVQQAKESIRTAEDQVKRAKGEMVSNGFMGTGWFRDWDSSIEIGMKGSSGSSVNATFRTAFNARYEDQQHRWDFQSFYLIDSEDNVTGENQVNATLVKDWFFKDTRWFAFASSTYDWDQFKDWNHRLQISAGPGYQFIKTEEWEFAGRVGGTGIFEFGKTIEDSSSPTGFTEKDILGFEALIGADLTWHITAKQRFTFSNYFYPSLTDGGEFRNLAKLDWIHDIDWFDGLAIKFGIRDEYDTTESIPNEFKYNFSLLWGF